MIDSITTVTAMMGASAHPIEFAELCGATLEVTLSQFSATILLFSGISKAGIDRRQLLKTILSYRLMKGKQSKFIAKLLPETEIGLAILIMSGSSPSISAAAFIAMLLLFTGIQIQSVIQGKQIECGCFGDHSKISKRTIIRNVAFLTVSVCQLALACNLPLVDIGNIEALLRILTTLIVVHLISRSRKPNGKKIS